jgi:hypothetical protein
MFSYLVELCCDSTMDSGILVVQDSILVCIPDPRILHTALQQDELMNHMAIRQHDAAQRKDGLVSKTVVAHESIATRLDYLIAVIIHIPLWWWLGAGGHLCLVVGCSSCCCFCNKRGPCHSFVLFLVPEFKFQVQISF